MSFLEERLFEWGEELQTVHLPRWDELPDFHLYMDQVVSLVNDYLFFTQIRDGEKLLTPSMINNYVKQNLIPKPIKKRYARVHLAHLIIIVLLKPMLAIPDIRKGIALQVQAFNGDYRAAYNLFCKQYEKTLQYIAKVAQGHPANDELMEKLPPNMLGTYMATLSVTTKIFAERVLVIIEEGAEMRLRKVKERRDGEGKDNQ